MNSTPTPCFFSTDANQLRSLRAADSGFEPIKMEPVHDEVEAAQFSSTGSDCSKPSIAGISLMSLLRVPGAPVLPMLDQVEFHNPFLTPKVGKSADLSHSLRPRRKPDNAFQSRMEPPMTRPTIVSRTELTRPDSVFNDPCLPEHLLCPDLPDSADAEVWSASRRTLKRRIPSKPSQKSIGW